MLSVFIVGAAPAAFSQEGNPEFSLTDVTVGKYLQAPATLGIMRTVLSQDLQVTITSGEPGRILFSGSATAAGQPTLTLSFHKGQREVEFYVQALGDSGTVTYTATATGIANGTAKATLTPSGVAIAGPYGAGKAVFLTTTGIPRQMSVYTARLDADHNYVAAQPLAAGRTVKVKLNNSNPKIGSPASQELEIAGGTDRAATEFQPATAGETDLSLSGVSGLPAAEKYSKVQAKILAPALRLLDTIVGYHLMASGSVILGQPAPAGGLEVKIACDNPGQVLFRVGEGAGSAGLTAQVPAGQSVLRFIVEGMKPPREMHCTATAPGYSPHTGTVTVAESGVIVTGPASITRSGVAHGFTASAAAGKKVPIIVYTAYLDPVTHRASDLSVQPLRPGMNVKVDLKVEDAEIGTVESPAQIMGGVDNGHSSFTPTKAGRTKLIVLTPAGGFSQPANATSILVLITP